MTEAEWRGKLKAAHICLDCRRQDGYTLGGHNYCYECNAKRNEKARAYREEKRAEINEKRREAYARKKEDRKCEYCGRMLGLLDSGVLCYRCRAMRSNRLLTRYTRRRIEGVCFQCCDRPTMVGKKLCAACYQKNGEKLVKMWEARKGNGGIG